jgi:type I restriction enzyme R subunit
MTGWKTIRLKRWLKSLTASFPGTGLISNNRYIFTLLLENTSVSVNHKTGEKSPTVRFVDFAHRGNTALLRSASSRCVSWARASYRAGHRPFLKRPAGGGGGMQIPKVKDAIPEAMIRYCATANSAGPGRGQRASFLL